MKKIALSILVLSTMIAGSASAAGWYRVGHATSLGNDHWKNYTLQNIDGKLYASMAHGMILELDPATGNARKFYTGTSEFIGTIAKAADGNLYTEVKDGRYIVKINPTTGQSSIVFDVQKVRNNTGDKIKGLAIGADGQPTFITSLRNKYGEKQYMGRINLSTGGVDWGTPDSYGISPGSGTPDEYFFYAGDRFGFVNFAKDGYELYGLRFDGTNPEGFGSFTWQAATKGVASLDYDMNGILSVGGNGNYGRSNVTIYYNETFGNPDLFSDNNAPVKYTFDGPDGTANKGLYAFGGIKTYVDMNTGEFGAYVGIGDNYNYTGAYKGHVTKINAMNGTWTDLGLVAADVQGINGITYGENGQIYVLTTNADKTISIYTNVPEPSSMLALASGLVGMAGFAIRRKRA